MFELIQTLYHYNAWANQRILEATARLSAEQFLQPIESSFPSIRDTLVHTMGAQWLWLSRWQGTSPRVLLKPEEFTSLEAIRSRWEQIEQETQLFLSRLNEADLSRLVQYVTTQGEPKAYPLGPLLLHQANHATQHRSEVAVILTRFGHSPGDLDLIYYPGL